ncbi:MAG TPA: hypothetical protein VHE34_23005 [Puia sp.]|uniref:hypothetical protein n=1 Tax=Puia sp. TaxID=2045100 RepID=UPI002C6246D9|nr:hypothetical protein [Puia sp.]HVU98119.1 hypothetical protein [Puia sp.]
MLNLYANSLWNHLPSTIKIRLIDESGNRVDPYQINEVDYLSRFINKCVVNKVLQRMMASNQKGVVEVYNDKVVVKEN